MVSIAAAEDEVLPLLAEYGDRVALAAVNGPASVVLSGDDDAVSAVADELATRGRRTRRLHVSHAFHSPRMVPMLAEFRAVVESLTLREPLRLEIASTVTGAPLSADRLASPDYWVDQVRATVRFGDAVAWLREHGVTTLLELGPDTALSSLVAGIGDDLNALPTLRPGTDEVESITAAAAQLDARGVPVRWDAWFEGTGASTVELPTYAFCRRRYWPRAGASAAGDPRAAGLGAANHPLLAATVSLAGRDGALLTGRLSVQALPWLADHVVGGTVLLPGSALVELALRAGDEVGCDEVSELTMTAPLSLPPQGAAQIQVWVGAPDAAGARPLEIHARPDGSDDEAWTECAVGTLSKSQPGQPPLLEAEWPPQDAESIDLTGLYERLAASGFAYGPAFQGLRAAWRVGGELFAEGVALPDGGRRLLRVRIAPGPARRRVAPRARRGASGFRVTRAAVRLDRYGIRLFATNARALRVRLVLTGDRLVLDLADPAGAPVARVDSLVSARGRTNLGERHGRTRDLCRLDWTAVPDTSLAASGALAVAGADPFGLAELLSANVWQSLDAPTAEFESGA